MAFRHVHPTIRLRVIPAADELLLEVSEQPPAAFLLNGLKALTIDTGSTAIAFGDTVRFVEGFQLRHMDDEPPEPVRRVRLRLVGDASSQFLETDGGLSPLTPPSP